MVGSHRANTERKEMEHLRVPVEVKLSSHAADHWRRFKQEIMPLHADKWSHLEAK